MMMRAVAGVLVVAVSCLLLVKAANCQLIPAIIDSFFSLPLMKLELCADEGSKLVQVGANRAKRNGSGPFTLSTYFNLSVPWDDKLSVEVETKLRTAWTTPQIISKFMLKNCEELMAIGKDLVNSFMKAANFDFKGCPLPMGNYSVKDWLANIQIYDIPFLKSKKSETTFKFSSDGSRVGCFKAVN